MITISVITIRHFLKIKAHHFQKIKRAFLISIFSSKVRNRIINCKLPILALSLSTIKISSPMLVFLLFYFSFLLLNLFWSIIYFYLTWITPFYYFSSFFLFLLLIHLIITNALKLLDVFISISFQFLVRFQLSFVNSTKFRSF